MASPSKEDRILELLFNNSPLKHWRFKDLLLETGMTRSALNKWLNKYTSNGLIIKNKEKNHYPYYTSGFNNKTYQSKKRIHMLNKIYQSGLIEYILSQEKIKTAIIFGSISKGDWYKGSDIDLFLLGEVKTFKKIKFEKILKRSIELHVFKSFKDIKKVKLGLIRNVINGYVIKGTIIDVVKVSS